MYPLHRLSRRARRASTSTLLASFAAINLLGGMVPSVSAQAALSVSIADVAVTEGTDPSAEFKVTVSGNHPNTGITVNYETRDGSAAAGLDYVSTSNTLTIPAGVNEGSIFVTLINDATYEPDETFKVKLLTASVNIADDLGIATVISPDPKPRVSIRNAQVTEGDGVLFTNTMVFDVELDRPANVDVMVDYGTLDDTAVGKPGLFGSHDYMSVSGTLTFPANTNVTQHVNVPVKGDSVYEGNEQFFVQLSNNFVALLGRDKATGTIVENESKPELSIGTSASATEGNGGIPTLMLLLNVNLSGVSSKDVTFSYNTFDGTAHAGNDYGAVATGSGTIPAGSTSGLVSVEIVGDTRHEDPENFYLTLSNQTNARLGNATVEITILDND